MITKEQLNKYKEWGLTLIPLTTDTKKPQSKFTGRYKPNGDEEWSWKKSKGITYSDNELLAASRLGIDHEASNTIDIDFDDKQLHAHKFIDILPATLTIGKIYNGSGRATANHKLFLKPKNVEMITESYPKKVEDKGKKIIELLPNTQSHYFGDREIINDTPPKRLTESQFQHLRQTVKEIYFLAMASQNYPKKDLGQRDEYILRLVGVMVKHTDWTTSKREDYLRRLLFANNDTDEMDNRINKISYQEEQLKKGKQLHGIPALVDFLKADKKVGLDWIDVLKKENDVKEYPLIDGIEFAQKEYPPVKFILYPIFTERSMNQVYGGYGSGKTMFALATSMAMCSGQDFVEFKSNKKVPTLYIEGELPAVDLRTRKDSIQYDYFIKKKQFNAAWHFTLTRDDLEQAGFKYGFDAIAISRNLTDPEANDYGRKGRELVSNLIRRIEKRTGVKPFFFLDNITALADIDENRATDWKPLTNWLIGEKNRGFANVFVHHANKSTVRGGSSGSNAKERLVDTSMSFEKLDAKHRFDMPGNKNVQCKVKFDKARNFGGSTWDREFMLTCNEEGLWSKYPMLDKYDWLIRDLSKEGLSVQEMVDDPEMKIAEKTIYKRLKKLKDIGIIKDEE
tara:strand:+ start:557 stop:2428 length:1872 start_codon:yes stop_codon:yes gene_type:complete